MKKIMFFIMCSAITTSLFALDIKAGGQAGLFHGQGGGSDWNDSLESGINNEFRLGFEMGGFWEIPINDFFSIQPELNFLLRRAGYGGENSDYTGTYKDEYTITTKSIEIPILAKLNFGSEKFKFFVLAGPTLEIIIGNIENTLKRKITDLYGSHDDDMDYSYAPDNRVIFGVATGLGFSVPAGNGRFIFDLRYRRTLSDFSDTNTKLSTIGFRIGYGLDIEL